MALSDIELIHQVKQGNDNAFEQLVYRYDRTVLSIALKYTGDTDDAKGSLPGSIYKSLQGNK